MPNQLDPYAFPNVVAQWLIVVVAVLGWVVAHIQNNSQWSKAQKDNFNRDERRELRTMIDVLVGYVKDLESKAMNFWLSEPNTPESRRLTLEIIRDSKHLNMSLQRLRQQHSALDVQNLHTDFNKALTGGEFESISRRKLDSNDSKFFEIFEAGKVLIDGIEKAYDHHCKPS